ncbi:hypothetical protein Spb1_34970 [Planctopirus ephydatiae]|uniref:Uncharacterized protein n=1 Tax=Planctopirus ephydatiae TaxID=2528019 RepID=A0A518GSJ2_9PLAN|nr:hypothetical protein Spb1_34970 [Planctopirus ephydatiae]
MNQNLLVREDMLTMMLFAKCRKNAGGAYRQNVNRS